MRKVTEPKPMLPVSLLVEGRPCLVVGGGEIAARKAGHLLDAKAKVTVVSPAACPEVDTLARAGKIQHQARPFKDADADGKYLVIAATDSTEVNKDVLLACHARGILCSASDSNWTEGDFVTPAICRSGGLVVTVSTGGRSCSEAKIVKDRIKEMLATITREPGGDTTHDDDNAL